MTQQLNASIYRQLFTDREWDAISSAMKDYADYGDEEANVADSIDAKITQIFKLTAYLCYINSLTVKSSCTMD